MGKNQKRKRNINGLYPQRHAKPLRWKIDQDYTAKLSRAEKEWLARFLDEYYSGDFDQETVYTQEEKRAVWRNRDRTVREDIYGLKNATGNLDYYDIGSPSNTDIGNSNNRRRKGIEVIPAEPIDDRDNSPSPQYLETPEYKKARENFRSALRKDNRPFAPPPSAQLDKARKALDKITPQPKDKEENGN